MSTADPKRVHTLVARILAEAASDLEDRARFESRACEDAGFESDLDGLAEAAVEELRRLARYQFEQLAQGRPLVPSLGLVEP